MGVALLCFYSNLIVIKCIWLLFWTFAHVAKLISLKFTNNHSSGFWGTVSSISRSALMLTSIFLSFTAGIKVPSHLNRLQMLILLLYTFMFFLVLLRVESKESRVSVAHTRAGHPKLQFKPSPSRGCGVKGIKPVRFSVWCTGREAAAESWESQKSDLSKLNFTSALASFVKLALLTFSTLPWNFLVFFSLSKWLVAHWQGYWLRCA